MCCHHLPSWYDKCSEFTAESHFFEVDEDLEKNVAALGWDAYFVKDFVKSNNANKGSIAQSPAQVREIVEQLELYRGEIEGGISIRRVEEYRPNTECRYFVVRGEAYSPNRKIPDLVTEINHLIDAPFYSIDIIENAQGKLRLVELGDGQVSSRKNWPLKKFIEMLTAIAKV
ncbi:ATP-grasp domain-containing protein [[Leptolyngbya] sp. PCC 7376]|uniref:ATP-grasp domain-containing protein n=1 Tax=[Leptolyngbya] sp. PCC 7376 TaxID=111781 RepID=UPI0002FD1DD9|nr:ATP-grasp domain-containing protein [[Leptolyngbya] sp. PCC 7376]